jgi:hypothetical protein
MLDESLRVVLFNDRHKSDTPHFNAAGIEVRTGLGSGLEFEENPDSKKTRTPKKKIYIYIPWFQRFIFILFIAKGRGKINLWLKAAIDSSSRANQFELGSDPDSVS